jgi:tetratricopeptide (TPR) repeat protein
VLYAAATESLLTGDTAHWLEYAKRAASASPRQQQRLIEELVAGASNENLSGLIDFVICQLQPNSEGLRSLYAACENRCPAEQLTPLVRYRAQWAEKDATGLAGCGAAEVWLEARELYAQLRDDVAALRCTRRALECDPGNWYAHYYLGQCLMQQQSYADAESNFRWCLQRTPDCQTVEAQFRAAMKGRLDSQPRTAAEADGPIR